MKVKIAAVVLAVTALAGCQKTYQEMSYSERKALSKTIAQRCIDQGFTKKSPEATACLRAEAEREIVGRENSRENARLAAAAVGNGFSAYGQSMSQGSNFDQPPRRMINCTSDTYTGKTVYTTCY